MLNLTPLARRQISRFRANRRASISLILFSFVFAFSFFAEVIANDRPLLIIYQGKIYWPVIFSYPETTFGGEFNLNTDYHDPYIAKRIAAEGLIIWPIVRFSYDSIDYDLPASPPTPPSAIHWLGTDDQGRDVFARLIHGYRFSILFGLVLTGLSTVIGIAVGACQGYFGGKIDLLGQRLVEIWSGMPVLYLLIIMGSLITPSFVSLIFLMLLFSWMSLVGVVRAEFLKGRNLNYVRSARALGSRDTIIMIRHVLPNAMVATLTLVPFLVSGAITTLTSLDFLGLGMPPGYPSLGEILQQGKRNLDSPWLGLTGFFSLVFLLSLLIFIGEGVRDAFDPRKESP